MKYGVNKIQGVPLEDIRVDDVIKQTEAIKKKQEEIVEEVATKVQPKLIAGSGITIDENNVISATGGGTGGSGISKMVVETKDKLPTTGSVDFIYFTRNPAETYIWDNLNNAYVCVGNTESASYDYIIGGDAETPL